MERLGNLAKVIQLVNGRISIGNRETNFGSVFFTAITGLLKYNINQMFQYDF